MEPERLLQLARSTAYKMHVPLYLLEDAASAAIVSGVDALRRWDKRSAEETWTILHMRWALRDFMRKELAHVDNETPFVVQLFTREFGNEFSVDQSETIPSPEPVYPVEWMDFLAALERLTDEQRSILIGVATGVPQAILSKRWKKTGPALKAVREQATAQLREELIISA